MIAGVAARAPGSPADVSLDIHAMGGTVRLRVACSPSVATRAERDLRLVAARIRCWADRLTRFSPASDLSALNRDPLAVCTLVRPTLGAALEAAMALDERCEGLADVTLLDARESAEAGKDGSVVPGRWWMAGSGHRRAVHRDGRVRFDLDGVGKGWIADRALGSLAAYPAVMVDADGDIALRLAPATDWEVAVADPRTPHADLAVLRVPASLRGRRLGMGTSGTSVHRWRHGGIDRHHIIDPRTGRSARTDVVQATVVAEDALVAEALAKSAVILGSDEGLALLERAGTEAAILLVERGDVVATPSTIGWLA